MDKEEVDFKGISLFFWRRMWALLSLCAVTPLGFWLWQYDGPGKVWFNFYALWDAVFLEKIRSRFLVMVLIGTCFVWWQFPHYVRGGLIGLVWIRALGEKGAR